MELHVTLRELVLAHGTGILADAEGFRGVLDDVLEEDQASTGDINLLVDAVRFDALGPLTEMVEGGADPARAVEEAGLRLARNRGGDDQAASSWAAAILGYAVGKVPEAVVARYRSTRPGSTHLPPPTGTAPSGPPVSSPPYAAPPTAWPAAPGHPTAPPPGSPTILPGHGSAPPAGRPSSYGSPASYPSAPGSAQPPGGYAPPPGFGAVPAKRKSPVVWVAAAVAGIVVVGGGVTAVVLASGGDDDPGAKKSPTTSETTSPTPTVDVEPAALDSRYNALASKVTAGASACEAASPGTGQAEVVDCAVSTGELRLVTYDDEAALLAARTARLDYRAGTLTADNGDTALYEFDPERGGTSDPAIVYWDSKSALQSATLTGEGSAKVDTLVTVFTNTSPRVKEPVAPAHPVLREFININMKVATCARQRTFFKGETEESKCEANVDGVVVNVGRYATRKDLRGDRKYYRGQYNKAATQGNGGTWRFGEGEAEGAYYAYLDSTGETATLYWDWNKSDCHCYGVAWSFDGNLDKLEMWWPSD